EVHIQREYTHSPERVWRALTEPAEIAQWLMRPEDFAPRVGQRFRLVAKPQPGWRGFVECEVLTCDPPRELSYSWVGNVGQKPMTVRFVLEATPKGTRLTFRHTGFAGVGGFLLAKLMLGPGWKKMLADRLPAVLDALAASELES